MPSVIDAPEIVEHEEHTVYEEHDIYKEQLPVREAHSGFWHTVLQYVRRHSVHTQYDTPSSSHGPLNPIEMPFSKVKAFLRKFSERTIRGLCKRIGSFVPTIGCAECRNYFRHAGYASI